MRRNGANGTGPQHGFSILGLGNAAMRGTWAAMYRGCLSYQQGHLAVTLEAVPQSRISTKRGVMHSGLSR